MHEIILRISTSSLADDDQMRAAIYLKNKLVSSLIKDKKYDFASNSYSSSLALITTLNTLEMLSKPKRTSEHLSIIIGKILRKHSTPEE